MKLRSLALLVFSTFIMAACAHKKEHKHAASCCEEKQECSMDKKDCDHCKDEKKGDKKDEAEHKH